MNTYRVQCMAASCAETHELCQPIDTTGPTPYLIRNTSESWPVHASVMHSFLRVRTQEAKKNGFSKKILDRDFNRIT